MINSDFKFGGSCSNIEHVCETTDTPNGCLNISKLESGGSCTVANNIITFDITTEIIAGQTLRLEATVINPGKYYVSSASDGILVFLESRVARYKFEVYSLTNIFGTSQITTTSPKATYLWGLEYNDGSSDACPIGMYKSNNYLVWNKITMTLGVETTLPSDSEGITLLMYVLGADMISESSISTSFSASSAGAVTCTPVLSTSSYIECKNIASVSTGTNYTLSFAFTLMGTKTVADLNSFGKYYFKMQGSDN